MAPSFTDAWKSVLSPQWSTLSDCDYRTALGAEKELLQCFSQERRTFDEFEHFLSESVALKPRAHAAQADLLTQVSDFLSKCDPP